jgi:hypothetical protein
MSMQDIEAPGATNESVFWTATAVHDTQKHESQVRWEMIQSNMHANE